MRLAQDSGLFRKKPALHKRRGVTLVELAIVLAIVGALTGALFAASSMATYRANFNQASDELKEIVINMHNLYAGQNTSYAALSSTLPSAFASPPTSATTSLFIARGVFPNEMLSPSVAVGAIPPAGTVANNPWNPGSTGSALVSLVGAADPVQFIVRYTGINAEICADLITRNSLPGRDTGLTQILVNSVLAGTINPASYPNTKPLPVSSVNATSVCSGAGAGGTYTIDWYYNVGS